jgi:hypothetical protein
MNLEFCEYGFNGGIKALSGLGYNTGVLGFKHNSNSNKGIIKIRLEY